MAREPAISARISRGNPLQAQRTDVFSLEKRSEIMSHVRGRNTKPELAVRSMLHTMGYRFRLHRRDLPGNPDIVLPKYRAVIFVHGCFWHQHDGCRRATLPKQNLEFWAKKLAGNKERDRHIELALAELGWRVIVVWGCEVSSKTLSGKLERALA